MSCVYTASTLPSSIRLTCNVKKVCWKLKDKHLQVCMSNLPCSLLLNYLQKSYFILIVEDIINHRCWYSSVFIIDIWATKCDFQQCGILTSVDSDEHVQPPIKIRNSKCCLVSSLILIEYSSDKQRLWSDCAYAQAGLSFCWSHLPHCWKSPVVAHLC